MTAQAKTTPTLFKIDPLKVFKRVLLKINYFRIFKHKFFKTKRFKILLAAAVGILGLLVVMVTALAGTTFIVNDTGDASDANAGDGICATATSVCTLRAAIEEADASSGSDTIKFNIGTGTKTISPGSQLPSITGPVTIDGTTQAATLGSLGIELKGSNAPSNANGLVIKGSDVTVRGLVINRFGNRGISIEGVGATNNKVEGNYVGTDATGTNDLGNSSYGVYVNSAPNNTIGGTASGARNVISGNNQIGIRVNGSSALEIQGNYIGTDATGTRDLGNFYGVMIESAPNNTIGGTTSGAGNVISGNDGYGVVSRAPGRRATRYRATI